MLERVLDQVDRQQRGDRFTLIVFVQLVYFRFDLELEQRTQLDLVDLDQVHREVYFFFCRYEFLAAVVKDVVQHIGQLIQRKVSLIRMRLDRVKNVLEEVRVEGGLDQLQLILLLTFL